MGVWSIINYTNLHPGLIFDAEHYHPARIAAWKLLAGNSTKSLADFAYEIEDLSEPDALKQSFDLTAALGQFLTQTGTSDATSVKKLAAPGDVLISRLRSYLKEVCVVPHRSESFAPQLSTEFIVLRSLAKKSIAWLLPFILSEPVQTVLQWSQTGSNHPRFSAATLLGLPVKNSVEGLRDKLNVLIESAVREYDYSSKAYPDAEKELLDRLGWKELLKQPREISYSSDFSKLANAERFDAESFHPSVNRVRAYLLGQKALPIDTLCNFVKHGVQPPYLENGKVGIVSQRQFSASGLGLDSLENFTDEAFCQDNPEFRLRSGDVLTYCVSAGEYLGRTFLFSSELHCVAASFVTVLRTSELVPGYLALFLNSPFGLIQSNALKRGTSPFYLYPRDLKRVLIHIPRTNSGKIDVAWQEAIAAKVEAATRGREQAKAKLTEAKRLVEEALSETCH